MKFECRSQHLFDWIAQQTSSKASHFHAMGSDASTRRYFRFNYTQDSNGLLVSMLAVDAPPQSEKNQRFVEVAKLLESNGVVVPKIHAVDYENGFLWLEDLGQKQLSDYLQNCEANRAYHLALQTLAKIQAIPCEQISHFELFDRSFIERELEIFKTWFVHRHCQSKFSQEQLQVWDSFIELSYQNVQQQPQVAMHRDYHSRNLMLNDEQLSVIDFQDMVRGPICYDLVSLLKDCYVAWPQSEVEQWLLNYAKQDPRLTFIDSTTLLRWFDFSGLQRHLKALGIFTRQFYQNGNDSYLTDVPRTWRYVLEVSSKYPELAKLHTLLLGYEAQREFK